MITRAIIEKGKDGSYGVHTPDTKSTVVWGEGPTVSAAKEDFLNSYFEILGSYEREGVTVPEDLVDLTFEYKYDIASLFNEFDFINMGKFARRVGINPSLMRHYKIKDTYISSAQAKKVESGLHDLARELLDVTL